MHVVEATNDVGPIDLDGEGQVVGTPGNFRIKRTEHEGSLLFRGPERHRLFLRRRKVGHAGDVAVDQSAGTLLTDVDDSGRSMDPERDFLRAPDVTKGGF